MCTLCQVFAYRAGNNAVLAETNWIIDELLSVCEMTGMCQLLNQ